MPSAMDGADVVYIIMVLVITFSLLIVPFLVLVFGGEQLDLWSELRKRRSDVTLSRYSWRTLSLPLLCFDNVDAPDCPQQTPEKRREEYITGGRRFFLSLPIDLCFARKGEC